MARLDQVRPHQPVWATEDLPGAGGTLGPEPEDFVVEELPLFAPSGSGQHWWVRIEKRLWSTPELVRLVAREAGVPEHEVGCAGMKDRYALTSQWLSVPDWGRKPDCWKLPSGVRLLEVGRHRHKLRTGQLRGNHFSVRLVGLDGPRIDRARAIVARIAECGLPNYFGPQRFGHQGQSLSQALDWMARGAPCVGSRTRFYRKLYPSVIQAEIFNRYLSARMKLGLERLLSGEVVRLSRSRALFLVENPAREEPRLRAGEIRLTGPIVGPKMRASYGIPARLEIEVLAELGWDRELQRVLDRLVAGTRRDLVVWPERLRIEPVGEDSVRLDFELPPGSYATQLVGELTRSRGVTATGSQQGDQASMPTEPGDFYSPDEDW